MHIFLDIIRSTVSIILSLAEVAMFARVLLSWLPIDENKISTFLIAITEPIVVPVRLIFHKLGWEDDLPIDIPFLVAFILLSIISAIL